MEATATVKTYRQSPRKVRTLAREIKGRSVSDARMVLSVAPKRAAEVLGKILTSVEANAREKDMNVSGLYIYRIQVDEGPTLFRARPRAHGRASVIRKRTSHITIAVREPEVSVDTKDARGANDTKEKVISDSSAGHGKVKGGTRTKKKEAVTAS